MPKEDKKRKIEGVFIITMSLPPPTSAGLELGG